MFRSLAEKRRQGICPSELQFWGTLSGSGVGDPPSTAWAPNSRNPQLLSTIHRGGAGTCKEGLTLTLTLTLSPEEPTGYSKRWPQGPRPAVSTVTSPPSPRRQCPNTWLLPEALRLRWERALPLPASEDLTPVLRPLLPLHSLLRSRPRLINSFGKLSECQLCALPRILPLPGQAESRGHLGCSSLHPQAQWKAESLWALHLSPGDGS